MAIAKRLSVAVLAVTFAIAVMAQSVLPARALSMAPMPMSAAAISAPGNGLPTTPCKQATPLCIEHVGCVTAVAISALPAATSIPAAWHFVRYASAVSPLAGRPVKPELSPPILAA